MTTVAVKNVQSPDPVVMPAVDISRPVSDIVETLSNIPEKEKFWDMVKTVYAFGLLGFGLLFPFVLMAWTLFNRAN